MCAAPSRSPRSVCLIALLRRRRQRRTERSGGRAVGWYESRDSDPPAYSFPVHCYAHATVRTISSVARLRRPRGCGLPGQRALSSQRALWTNVASASSRVQCRRKHRGGSAKSGRREFRRYLDISIGSLSELSYTLQLCRKLEFLSEEQWAELDRLRSHASRLTWRLYTAFRGQRAPTA